MTMNVRLRKLALTTHVTVSVGWFGAITTFSALAIVGLTARDEQTLRATYLVAQPLTEYVLVPLAIASLLTGLIQSLGTAWGLFRHYWILFKLVINIVATVVLLTYTGTVDHFAAIAADPSADLAQLRSPTFVLHSTLALFILLVATVLAVYKPRGMTPYGQRRQHERRRPTRRMNTAPSTPSPARE
jgi:hypothetical protein